MKEQETNYSQIQFRKVYLSDLNALIRLYKNQGQNQQPTVHQLTENFGLPLSIALNGEEIIGFAFASINQLDELMLSTHTLSVADAFIDQKLKSQAEVTLHTTFTGLKQDHTPLKIAIEQLVSWLNTCAN
ncbi:hypothetical protein [Pedobacter gandavensis]|uniref:hypothetical protein n=1 Tax=Pedobacter gandavensis TaxID=2679963 RepID=UPI00292D5633|nr:hypothetical protein [Pedobacter gandavensis]